jgi:hypothetical protein
MRKSASFAVAPLAAGVVIAGYGCSGRPAPSAGSAGSGSSAGSGGADGYSKAILTRNGVEVTHG